MIYSLFNEPAEAVFRNELFRRFSLACLASKVLTQFIVCSEMQSYMIKENSVNGLLETQLEALKSLENYRIIDPLINSELIQEMLLLHIGIIKTAYGTSLAALPMRSDYMQILNSLGN